MSRKRRLRSNIRDDLSLVDEIGKNELLRDHTPAIAWLHGKIALDVAKLAEQRLGTPKKPLDKGAIAVATIIGVGFAGWTYLIVRNGFVWYGTFPAIVAVLMGVSILGMVTGRQLPPGDDLPPGAVPLQSSNASEHVATAAALGAEFEMDERFGENGQIGICFQFLRFLRQSNYEAAIELADENWIMCRVQAWLWNNRRWFTYDEQGLRELATNLIINREPSQVWTDFVETEKRQFVEAMAVHDPDRMGAGSQQRRVARDYELVVLAPTGDGPGYFVPQATLIPNSVVILVHKVGSNWLVANYGAGAPPVPGWPPAWWIVDDPVLAALDQESPDQHHEPPE